MPGACVQGPATEALFCYAGGLLSVGRIRKVSICSRNPRVERVEQAELVLVSIRSEMAVGLVNHLQRHAHPSGRLSGRGISVGRDHIAATVNTLVLAYAGAALPVLLVFSVGRVPFETAVNSEAVAEEIVAMLVGSIGLIAAAPLTTAAGRAGGRAHPAVGPRGPRGHVH